jgi:hypothetical protein
MNIAIVVASSALALILALALARERRIRCALQRLLARLLTFWRNQHAEDHESDSGDDDAHRARHDRVR